MQIGNSRIAEPNPPRFFGFFFSKTLSVTYISSSTLYNVGKKEKLNSMEKQLRRHLEN